MKTLALVLLALLPHLEEGEPVLGIGHENAPDGGGIRIMKVAEKSPAEKAGMKVGDLLTEFDGKKISNGNDLESALFLRRPGEEVATKVLREGNAVDLRVTLGKRLPRVSTFKEKEGIERVWNDQRNAVAKLPDEERKRMEATILRTTACSVRVVAGESTFGGSGVFVADGQYVVTAGHVVKENKEVKIYTDKGTPYRGKVVKNVYPKRGLSNALDIAIVKIDNPRGDKLPAAPVGSSSPLKKGTPLLLMGYPMSHGIAEDGKIMWGQYGGALAAIPRTATMNAVVSSTQIEIDRVYSEHGDSGAPIFDMDGNVVGIIVGRNPPRGFMTSAETVTQFLNELKEQQ